MRKKVGEGYKIKQINIEDVDQSAVQEMRPELCPVRGDCPRQDV